MAEKEEGEITETETTDGEETDEQDIEEEEQFEETEGDGQEGEEQLEGIGGGDSSEAEDVGGEDYNEEEDDDEEKDKIEEEGAEEGIQEEEEEKETGEESKEKDEEKPTLDQPPMQSEELRGKIDEDTMKQLEKVEREAKEAAEAIYELKNRVKELLQIAAMTEQQSAELEEKNAELVKQMVIFDEKTREIQEIIAKTNILESMPTRQPQAKYDEDVLPRVILCGFDQDYVPKIVVCDQKTKGKAGGARACSSDCPGPSPPTCEPQPSVTAKICDDFNEKDRKIAANNAEMEKMKALLEEDITNKDRILSELQLKLAKLENEIRTVTLENATLDERIRKLQMSQKVRPNNNIQKEEKKKVCPVALEAKLNEYSRYTRNLENQLADMEKDFEQVLREVKAAKKEREKLNEDPYCRRSCR